MKIALIVALVVSAEASLSARYISNPGGIDPVAPIVVPDLRLRLPNGQFKSDLTPPDAAPGTLKFESPRLNDPLRPAPRPWNLPYPKPIAPQGDDEFPAIHYAPKPDFRLLAPMPVVKGVFVPSGMPMKMPDPAVDYKLRVLDAAPLAAEHPAKK